MTLERNKYKKKTEWKHSTGRAEERGTMMAPSSEYTRNELGLEKRGTDI